MESSLDSEQLVIGYANSRQSPIDAGMVLKGILFFIFWFGFRFGCGKVAVKVTVVVGVCECV